MRFYMLLADSNDRKGYAWSFPAYEYPSEVVSCEKCKRKWLSYKKLYEENLPFKIVFTRNKFMDFLSCEGLVLVNERVKKVLIENCIKSPLFAQMPVLTRSEMTEEQLKEYRGRKGYNIVRRFHDEQPVYYKLSAGIDAKYHVDSNVIFNDSGKDVCVHCGYGVGYIREDYTAPKYIDLSSWGGNDIFRVTGFGIGLYCTEKFKNLCDEHGFKGAFFEEIEAR